MRSKIGVYNIMLVEIYQINVEEFCFLPQNYILGAFKPACHISITFADEKNRKKVIFVMFSVIDGRSDCILVVD